MSIFSLINQRRALREAASEDGGEAQPDADKAAKARVDEGAVPQLASVQVAEPTLARDASSVSEGAGAQKVAAGSVSGVVEARVQEVTPKERKGVAVAADSRKEDRPAGKAEAPTPFAELKPSPPEGPGEARDGDGWWRQTLALLRYMTCTEVHTYAFSVAANVILALFPFIVLMLTLAQRVFHSPAMVVVLGDLMRSLLPTSQDFVMRNMTILAHPKKGTQLFSLLMLFITSTGVFLPLEVALNSVWGVKKNRNYLGNQLVALGLAGAVGALVMASVALTAGQKGLMTMLFFGHTDNFVFYFVANGVLKFCAVVASILLFFLIYWILPNRKIPAMAVLPTAIVVGLAWEVAKYLYVLALPRLDFEAVYGPFRVSVGLMMWAFLSGLLLLAGAHVSATRYTLRLAREAEE